MTSNLCLKIVCLSIAFFSFIPLTAQVTGKLTDEKGSGLGFASVTLIQATDNKPRTTVITDSAGKYIIPLPAPGHYFLRFTAIGFAETRSDTFELIAGRAADKGITTMHADTKNLNNVTVTALRPTIVQEADKLVVTVENTAMAQGNTAFTLLSKAPGVFIDAEGNIQLNGRSGVNVMINGKLTYLSARDLRTMLESMPAENIKNIEIITNPSAKYDAEGTSGILNINLKKNTQRGMNGSVYSSANYNFKQAGYSYGANLNFKGGGWNSFINADGNRRVGGRDATFTRVFYGPAQTIYFDQTATGDFRNEVPASVRAGTDYEINSRHSLGVMGYYVTARGEDDFLSETLIGHAPKSYHQFIDADNLNRGTFRNITGNLHYMGKLDTLGQQLSADLDYVNIRNRRESDLFNYFTDLSSGNKTTDILYTYVPAAYNIWSAKADYTYPFSKKNKLEAGVKFSHVVSDNDSRFYFNNGALVPDPNRTNYFNYRENIYAAYLNWSGTISKKLSAQAGLRTEQTKGTGTSYTTGQVNKRNYLDLFPSLFVQQKVNDNYGINYSYSRRLTRPNYGNLNPFRAYRDPYTWYEGNTSLRPQYTHQFSVAQTFKKTYILTATYQLNKDVMSEIPILDVATGTTIYTTGNVDDGHSASLSFLAPVRLAKKWETQNTVLFNYSKFTMNSNLGRIVNEQLFFMVQSNHTILLPEDFRLELNLLFRGPAASGLYRMASMHREDIALKKSFLKKKFDVTINANDIFKGFRYLWTTNLNGNVNDFDQYFRWRSIGLSLRYNFSRGQKVNIRQRNSIEEAGRAS
ncbi:MAG: TonB-dependent receptor [Chitinophagaceae bacterium]